jgi:hypothetical protein
MFNAGTVCTGRVLGSALSEPENAPSGLITIEPGGEQVVNGPHWYSYRRLVAANLAFLLECLTDGSGRRAARLWRSSP